MLPNYPLVSSEVIRGSNITNILALETIFFMDIASHPLNGWIWFGEGLRGYDNWQRCAASDFNQNEHGETAIPLKTVAATTPKSRAEEKLLRLI